MPNPMPGAQPDHEKAVIGQMLMESTGQVVGLRVQIAVMQAAIAEKDAEIASLKAQLAPPVVDPAPAENQ